jgi:hypothetical protein
VADSVIGGGNQSTRIKTTNLSQVTDKHFYIVEGVILYEVDYSAGVYHQLINLTYGVEVTLEILHMK